jgi:exodeoxyribonuclease VII large subunit
MEARLVSLSPLAVLDRGYALVLGDDGKLIRSAAQVAAGDKVRTRLADGEFTSRIEETEKSRTAKRKGKSLKSG